jgi:hypothetical protein
MLLKHLTFTLSNRERDFEEARGPSIIALRATAETLEFNKYRTNGTEQIFVLHGQRLWTLLPEILDNQLRDFVAGERGIDSITKEVTFTPLVKGVLGPERNPVKSFMLCVDTGLDRFYFPHESLEAWGCAKSPLDYRLFVQFKALHSFILHAAGKNEFADLLIKMKHDNFNLGSINKISTWADRFYWPNGDKNRYQLSRVEFKKEDVAISGAFTILMDNRLKAPALQQSPEKAKHRQPVGMDVS